MGQRLDGARSIPRKAGPHAIRAGQVPGISFATDIIVFSGQHGAPTIDVSYIDRRQTLRWYRCRREPASALGIETYPKEKFVNRGVLLDVRATEASTSSSGRDCAADREETSKHKASPRGGLVLIHTGQGKYFEADREKYMRVGGIGEDQALARGEERLSRRCGPAHVDAGFPFPDTGFSSQNGIHSRT